MKKEWLEWSSIGIILVAFLLLGITLLNRFHPSEEISLPQIPETKNGIEASSFVQPKTSYEAIGSHVIELKAAPKKLPIPDLKKVLIYHGRNGRPDANIANSTMYFSLVNAKTREMHTLIPNQKFYLFYDKKQSPSRYVFSPNNRETSLWIEVTPEEKEALIIVGMKDDQGEELTEPAAHARFTLNEKAPSRQDIQHWDLGKNRVDGTILARQKARWYGVDQFLEKHGGEEFRSFSGKQRIDFGEGGDAYSIFIQIGDVFIWEENRWKGATPGEETIGKPLLVVTKAEDRLSSFELWDPDGKSKVLLNLLKSTDVVIPVNIVKSLKFMGAKTRTQLLFDFNGERLQISPNDWLLFQENGIKPLATPEEIDAYVDRKWIGYLLIFDSIEKKEDKTLLIGTIFNRSRTALQPVEVLLQPGESASMKSGNESKTSKSLPKPSKGSYREEDEDIE